MRLLFCCLVAMVISCNKPTPKNVGKANRLDLLADRSCRAISIRQQRFALANKIRFATDTLASLKGKADTMRLHNKLQVCLGQKDSLLKASLALADTIRMQLDSMMPYSDKPAQKRFTAKLDSIIKAKGCEVTTREDNIPRAQ